MSSADIEQMLLALAAGPGRFAALLSRLEDADSLANTSMGEWSPAEVLAHVRASYDIMAPRLLAILARDNPPLTAYDERRWATVAQYATLPLISSLESMRLQRQELVRALRRASDEDWRRTGTHETLGPMTLLDVAKRIAEHEEEHLAQLEQSGADSQR